MQVSFSGIDPSYFLTNLIPTTMKIVGIVLLISGLLMCIFTSVNFTQEKKIVDLGPIQINQKQNKTVRWPIIAGVAVAISGIVLVVVDKKQKP